MKTTEKNQKVWRMGIPGLIVLGLGWAAVLALPAAALGPDDQATESTDSGTPYGDYGVVNGGSYYAPAFQGQMYRAPAFQSQPYQAPAFQGRYYVAPPFQSGALHTPIFQSWPYYAPPFQGWNQTPPVFNGGSQ